MAARISAPPDFVALLPAAARRCVVEREYRKGLRLFGRGDRPAFMFCILAGEARLVRTYADGSEIVFQRARRGFLAEASLDQPAYHGDGIAATQVTALALPVARFREALAQDAFRSYWLGHLSRELRRSRAHGERLALRSAGERIVHYIETEGAGGMLTLHQTKKSWAGELGLTHEALYRALATMRRSGALAIEGDRLRLLGPATA